MIKDIKPYKQNKMTCAIACMLMILEYNRKIEKANISDEFTLYDMYHSQYMEGTPFSALALHLGKNGLKTKLIHSEKTMFNNEKHLISEYIFEKLITEYNYYIDKGKKYGLEVETGIDISSKLLKQYLDQDTLIIIAGMHKNMFHAVLLYGYENNNFYICDPISASKKKISYEELYSFMNTAIGKLLLIVYNK